MTKEIKIKFVKKANMWCKTTIDGIGLGKNKQEWFVNKPKDND